MCGDATGWLLLTPTCLRLLSAGATDHSGSTGAATGHPAVGAAACWTCVGTIQLLCYLYNSIYILCAAGAGSAPGTSRVQLPHAADTASDDSVLVALCRRRAPPRPELAAGARLTLAFVCCLILI